MHRGGRHVVLVECIQVLGEVVAKAVLAMGPSRNIAGGVAILTPMLAAGIYIDAVPMA
jgi:hypothetical protein